MKLDSKKSKAAVKNSAVKQKKVKAKAANPEKAPNIEKCGVQICAGINSASGQVSRVISSKSRLSSPKIGRPSE